MTGHGDPQLVGLIRPQNAGGKTAHSRIAAYDTYTVMNDFLFIDPLQFKKAGVMCLLLMDGDLHNASLSLDAYKQARAALVTGDMKQIRNITSHAANFVVAIRRAGRMLQAMSANSADFLPTVAEAVKLEWKKKHSFYEPFRKCRDAIEHVDSEVRDATVNTFYCIVDDLPIVSGSVMELSNAASIPPHVDRAPITDAALSTALSSLNVIRGSLLAAGAILDL